MLLLKTVSALQIKRFFYSCYQTREGLCKYIIIIMVDLFEYTKTTKWISTKFLTLPYFLME